MVLCSVVAPAGAQVRLAAESLPKPLTEILSVGQQLESQQRWGEALTHYEEALREHPGQPLLKTRYDLAKVHFDLTRRYADDSFRQALRTVAPSDALEIYAEILLKINAHYVTPPDWRSIVARGTAALDVAIGDEKFQRMHGLAVDQERIAAFRRALYAELARRSIRSRYDARAAVATIAGMAQGQLGLTETAVALEYACGAVGGLDGYSAFLTGDQLRDAYAQIDGNFVGLGVELKADNGSLLLVNIIPNSPAESAGLQAGDRIIAVDGQATDNMSTEVAAARLQGTAGSMVRVTVQRGEEQLVRDIRRQQVEVPSILEDEVIDADYGIAYLKLTSFQKTTVRELDTALWKLYRAGMRSLIVDLRGNPGGLLTASVEVADKFLTDGTIVSTRGRSAGEDFNYRARREGTWRVPLIVLIDEDSASASEIFAAAIADNRRGTILGVRSFGKGSVQGIFPLSSGDAGIRLTTAKFYSPSGRPISKAGVQPNVVVRKTAKVSHDGQVPAAGDEVLSAAVRTARRQLASR